MHPGLAASPHPFTHELAWPRASWSLELMSALAAATHASCPGPIASQVLPAWPLSSGALSRTFATIVATPLSLLQPAIHPLLDLLAPAFHLAPFTPRTIALRTTTLDAILALFTPFHPSRLHRPAATFDLTLRRSRCGAILSAFLILRLRSGHAHHRQQSNHNSRATVHRSISNKHP